MNQLRDRVEALIQPVLEAMDFDLVRVMVQGTVRTTVQVMAERRGGGAMTVDDCAEISRAVSAVLDVEDPLPGSYTLEVSSPGIDRPLVRSEDFERFTGFEAKIETARPIAGRKRFRGKLLGTTEAGVRIALGEGETELPFGEIHRAKLVLSDELIAAMERQRRV
ncbi:MAG: ribosome maturation factor RimP [Proteobacteria bacterium]|nr:ribosome maturation factor RimP [Pseudomonadota bacterium]